ncbi:hypothetical protein Vretimale_15168 [Volvox reticuliferus]|uniref:Uncharacterized protein n=1 Tax=Volvox reticuliferus TaxID=1737510 RepID=A0A8J4C4X6_9CHLO|nr:hypothetical protein Vretifemale_5346 [Volvox reticuliferus]GIM11655.1 hypothetical protein Vretimale_15168 [Volvox reticuliferus]
MQILQELSINDDRKRHHDKVSQYGQVDRSLVDECPARGLSENCSSLLSPSGSKEEVIEFNTACVCISQMQRHSTEVELFNFQESGQGARPRSLASLTCNGYASPSSGDSTPTSKGSEVCSITDYNVAGIQNTDDSASSTFGGTALTLMLSKDQHPAEMFCGTLPVQEASSGLEETSSSAPGEDEDGPPYVPREIHPSDIQLARMLAAVSQATNTSPAQLLQVLLNVAAEDFQDLVNAVVESGCSCVHLLACHLHNLRTMAEEAIDHSSDTAAADGTDDKAVEGTGSIGSASSTGSTPALGSSGKPPSAGGNLCRTGKAASQPVESQEIDSEDKVAQEALRASILDQYRRVVLRLVETALVLLNGPQPAKPKPPPPPPPPPPPSASQNRNGGGASGGGSRARADHLSRSRSVPSPSLTIVPSPPAALPGAPTVGQLRSGPGQKAVSQRSTLAQSTGGLGSTAPSAHPAGPSASEQLLGATDSTLAARGRSLSAALSASMVHAPTAAAAVVRERAVTTGSYTGTGKKVVAPQAPQVASSKAPAVAGATVRLRGTQVRGPEVANVPLQRLQMGDLSAEPHHAAAIMWQQQQQLHLQQHLALQQQLQQELQRHQRLQQLQQQQMQLEQFQLLELLAAANADVNMHGVPFDMALPNLPVLSPSNLAPSALPSAQAEAFSVASAAAQLMQAYDGIATVGDPGVWQSADALTALQWQLPAVAPTQNPSGLALSLPSQVNAVLRQQTQQRPLMMVHGNLLTAGTAGSHATTAAVPYSGASTFTGAELSGAWML